MSEYIVYRCIKYRNLGGNKWLIIWPSGLKKEIEIASEEMLKVELDKIIEKIT